MRPIEIPELSPEAIEELAHLYRTTHNLRLHTRAQMVLLAAEQHMVAADIAKIVRTDEQTVRRWLKRYLAEGIAGLSDAPHPGATPTVTAAYKANWRWSPVNGRVAWTSPTRCGPVSAWPITWPSKPASG